MIRRGVVLLTWVSLALPVWADNVQVTITGEIFIPPCTVNGANTVEVVFPDASVVDIAVYPGSQPVPTTVPVSCTYYQGTPYVKMTGAAVSGFSDNNVLTTGGASPTGLGIALFQGGSVDPASPLKLGAGTVNGSGESVGYPLNVGLSVPNQASSNFTFTSALVLLSGPLNAGSFSATANMMITYL